MKINRVNITLNPELHTWAQAHAASEKHLTSFSGLITKLLLAEKEKLPPKTLSGQVEPNELPAAKKPLRL